MARRTADTGRSRVAKAERRQQKIIDGMDRSWMKYMKCSICRRKFCVNNYSDHKVRLWPQCRVAGKIVCLWCLGRDGKYIIQLRLIAEQIADHKMSYCNAEPQDRPRDGCKCLACVAGRVIATHDALPVRR